MTTCPNNPYVKVGGCHLFIISLIFSGITSIGIIIIVCTSYIGTFEHMVLMIIDQS